MEKSNTIEHNRLTQKLGGCVWYYDDKSNRETTY